jgi:hypothetical protein
MMPSSASNGPDQGGSNLRRWGPVAAIVAVLAIVGGIVALAGGGDDDDTNAGGTTTTAADGGTPSTGEAPATGAISFQQAQEEGLDVTFPETCDEETGRVAIPYYYAPPCFANVDDNGGATDVGVTGDSIKVVVYIAPEQDAVLDFITAAIANDDTNEQVKATIQGYVDILNATYQTYGRTVEIEFLDGSGQSTDEVAARADAVRAVEEMGAFAVWGSPVLNDAFSEELAARGVPCVTCFPLPEPGNENIFSLLPSARQNNLILAEYLLKKLAGDPAVHAGDEALQGTERVFGHLYIETSEADVEDAEHLQELLEEEGSGFAEQISYILDPSSLQEQATPIMSRFKQAGVTSVVVQGDPIAMATFTREATAQDYFPEWVIGPSTLIDTAAFGRTYDQEQWAHAFGLSPLAARLSPDADETLYEWYFGEEDPANESEGVLSPDPLIFFNALQLAGPNLTRETLRQGLHSFPPGEGSITGVSFSYGDHGLFPGLGTDQAGIDDWTEIWWDADEVGPDELDRVAPGLYRYVDGGERFFVGEVPEELRVFEEEGSVTIYEELPESEADRVGDYEPPPR